MSSLILASASPRRRELLALAGLDFTVIPGDVDEIQHDGETPADQVRRLARAKALGIAEGRPEDWVLGADTLVVIDNLVMGKPRDREEAGRMLRLLSGRTHQVLTGYCLVNLAADILHLDHAVTEVTFETLTEDQINAYLDSGEPQDKAGAYAIQDLGAALVERINGSYTNVVGLPLSQVLRLLRKHGLTGRIGG